MRKPWREVLTVLVLAVGAALLMGPTWPRDDSGTPAAQCSFIGSAGTPTLCSTTDALPVLTGAPTQSTTDPTGFGKAFFDSNGTAAVFTGRAGTPAVFVSDQTAVAFQMAAGASPTAVLTYYSTNAGRTWALVSTSSAVFNMTNSNTAIRVGTLYLVGMTPIGALDGLMSSGNGTTWTNQDLPGIVGASIRSIAAQGSTVLLGTSTGHICRSTNSGASFSSCVDFASIITPSASTQGIASPSPNVWLIGDDAGNVARSTDDGVSFPSTVLNMGGTRSQIVCLSATVCVAASGNAIHRSTNAGATWTSVFSYAGVGDAAGFVNYGTGVVVAIPSGATAIFRSVDFGATWNFQGNMPHALAAPLGPIDSNSGRAIIAQGPTGTLPPVYSPVVGAGETIIAGQSGNRWDIDPAGAGLTRQKIVTTGLRPHTFPIQFGLIGTRTCSTPAANTAASLTVAGVAGQNTILNSFIAYYDVAPAAPTLLTVTDAGALVWRTPVAGANTPTRDHFGVPVLFSTAGTLVITLPAGGAGVSGTLCAVIGGPFAP